MKEDVGTIKVCVAVKNPVITCPINFDFTVHVQTVAGTAGMYLNHTSLSHVSAMYYCCTNLPSEPRGL